MPPTPKVAVVEAGAVSVRTQVVAVPVHEPLQPLKVLPVLGLSVSVTCVPDGKLAVHVPVVQLIPPGELVMVPAALPARVTDKVIPAPKFAVTEVAAVTVTTQVLVPEQAPPQPVKSAPVPAVAVSVT